jgi:uncharacterized protein YlxP (DUF503 family)
MRHGNRKAEAIHVSLCDVRLRLPPLDSLKGKRGIAKSVIARIRNRFNVAIAEVRHLDSKEYLGLGFVTVANDAGVVDGVISEVVSFLEEDRRFEVEAVSSTEL